MTKRKMTDEEFEEYFDNGGDTTAFMVPGTLRRPGMEVQDKRINISMPEWMVDELDVIAKHYGNSRQGVINMWVGERLKQERKELASA